MKDATLDRESQRRYDELLPRLFDYVDKFSKEKGSQLALIEYDTGEKVTWKDFATKSKVFAAKLLAIGLKKGDIVATSLPLLKEHIYLMYACYRLGIIIAPLDLRLKTEEINRNFDKMKPHLKAYFFLGKTEVVDFRPMIAEVMKNHSDTCKHWVQFQKEGDLIMDGAIGISEFIKDMRSIYIKSLILRKIKKAQRQVLTNDPCLIIFTTGSTGFPKPALLSHKNILVQNIGLCVGFGMSENDIMCVNLPPSHVGCTTEQLATTIYGGGTSVILHIFDAEKTLDAIQKHNVTILGQIPALFAMQWRLPNYNEYDLSSLRFALYGGQAVTRVFLEQLSTMAPEMGSGLGLTESAGFLTYTPFGGSVEDILASIGYDISISPISIREPMKDDGSAGEIKAPKEVGEICFSGPQVFLGYLGDEENTRKTISTDNICYTGDLGIYDDDEGLHFAGRAKFLIKPKGYNVFPTEVEDFIERAFKGRVGTVSCVGIPHEIFTEGIMAFIERKKGVEISKEELEKAVKEIASFKRPSHYEIIDEGQIPLTRVGKTDYMTLRERGITIAEKLRVNGEWDA